MYLRVSLDHTGEEQAIDRYRKDCLAIIEARGWELVGEYIDNSISASDRTKVRPGYNSLIAAYERGEFDALVCSPDLDRLTRQPRQLEDWIEWAESGELALVTSNGEADLTTDAGRLFARIKLAVARGEIERKGARQRLANKQRSEQGRPPLGVRLTGYTSKGELVPDEAAIVERIFADFLETRNLRLVARGLQEDGILTRRGKPWHPSTIQTILRNPRYAGRAIYRGEETGQRGAWVAIVSDEEYEAAQAILDDPGRLTNRGRSTERKHLGSGLYLCVVCGEPLSSWSGGRYRCRGGAHVNRSQDRVDQYVLAVISARLSSPDMRRLVTKLGAVSDAQAPLLEEVTRVRDRLTQIDADYDAGITMGTRYKTARDRAEADLRIAQAALSAAQSSSEVASVLAAPDPSAAFLVAPLMTQRAVIDTLAVVKLHKGMRYTRVFDPETVQIEWR